MTTRNDLPRKIATLLEARANVALHGSPGSGKSWLVDRVQDQLLDRQVTVARIDLSVANSGRDVFLAVSAALSATAGKGDSNQGDLQACWKEARKRVSESSTLLILILDQFDRVIRFPDAQDFLLRFRELVHRPETLGCVALVASRRSLQSIEVIVQGISILATICYPEYLGSVRRDDLEPAWPNSFVLSPSERDECLEWSGGHPALVKYWLATRPDMKPDGAAEAQRTAVIFRVLDYLEESRLLDATAQLVLGPVIDDWALESQELELLGILPEPGTDDSKHVLSGQRVFRDALRSRTWSMNPWGVLGHCEVQTRSVIESVLSENYGEEWAAIVCSKSGGVRKAFADANEKLERDRRTFRRHASWLSYTYPADLWAIISAEWPLFTPIFNTHDKPHWRQVFTGLSEYRAPLAHGRPEVLGDSQRTQCRLYADEITARILLATGRLGSASGLEQE